MSEDAGKSDTGLMAKMFDYIVGSKVTTPAVVTVDADPIAKLTADVAAMNKRFDDFLTTQTKTADADTATAKKTDDAAQTFDAAAVGVKLAATRSRAEILVPGIKFATSELTTDAAAHTFDCACQREALTKAWSSADTRPAIIPFAGETPDFAKMNDAQIELAFNGAAEVMRLRNNAATASGSAVKRTADTSLDRIEQFQEEADAHWAKLRTGVN